MSQDEIEARWSDYIFDDDEELSDCGDDIPDGVRIDRQSLSEEGKMRLALRAALESISNVVKLQRISEDLSFKIKAYCDCYIGTSVRALHILSKDCINTYGFGHHRYPALERSAMLGCPLCEFFLANIHKIDAFCSADLTIDQRHVYCGTSMLDILQPPSSCLLNQVGSSNDTLHSSV